MKKIILSVILGVVLAIIMSAWGLGSENKSPRLDYKEIQTCVVDGKEKGEYLVSGVLTKISVIGDRPMLMLEFEDGFVLMCWSKSWATFKMKAMNNIVVWKASGEIKSR